MLSGSLASPTPPGGGGPKERGDEENETESRSDLQGPGGVGRHQRRQDANRIGRAIQRPPHSDHRMETTIVAVFAFVPNFQNSIFHEG